MESVQFVRSAVRPDQYPVHHAPEVALVGRSNVGKSSLINALAGRKNVAKVSGQPGRTQTINFYSTGDGIWLVDLPGYGYAAVPRRVQSRFAPMIETYLEERQQLIGVLLVLDARHGPTKLDMEMKEWLLHTGLPTVSVATKWDKLKRSEESKRRKEMESALGWQVLPFSSTKGVGKGEVESLLRGWARDAGRRP